MNSSTHGRAHISIAASLSQNLVATFLVAWGSYLWLKPKPELAPTIKLTYFGYCTAGGATPEGHTSPQGMRTGADTTGNTMSDRTSQLVVMSEYDWSLVFAQVYPIMCAGRSRTDYTLIQRHGKLSPRSALGVLRHRRTETHSVLRTVIVCRITPLTLASAIQDARREFQGGGTYLERIRICFVCMRVVVAKLSSHSSTGLIHSPSSSQRKPSYN
ncbi:hypothetical protein F5B22DRAFT_92760 [Xylaria bambusicola]|uniref:uncharacterized protein n=1 Tax=Xylaria bambusicola TaxID=326684 RepID=UPI002008436B|nr:uncharacterized protein F5B22DRAFT_92760 [Xylaria bambusicola]KAI0518113.1 hypothetical protein F5B22DRAFT_92760 [Xylaria bambusicola]